MLQHLFSSSRNRKKVMIGAAVVLILAGLVGVYAQKASSDTKTPPTPTDKTRSERTIPGTAWRYTVDTSYESSMNIRATHKVSGGSETITLSGQGCNGSAVTIAPESPTDGPELSRRDISGTVYVLTPGFSTLMACMGERADYDQRLQQEFRDIFDSLRRD